MPRTPRIQFEGAYYHVYHRGNRRDTIFLDDQDYARFENILLEAMNWSAVRLFSWKLMPNHFHMLVETPEGNLAEFMQRLLTRYAKYFNWRHQLVGHLFQGRYGAKVCDKQTYFMELLRYIELNAYKDNPLAKIGEWKWSSLRYLLLPKSQWPEGLEGPFREVLGCFSDDLTKARQAYSAFLAEGLKKGTWKDFYQPKGNCFLGDEQFVEKVKQRTGATIRETQRDLRIVRTAEELADVVSKLSGISHKAFSDRGQERMVSSWRQALVYVGRTRYRLKVNDLARVIGREANAASQILRRLSAPENRPEIQQLLEALRQ